MLGPSHCGAPTHSFRAGPCLRLWIKAARPGLNPHARVPSEIPARGLDRAALTIAHWLAGLVATRHPRWAYCGDALVGRQLRQLRSSSWLGERSLAWLLPAWLQPPLAWSALEIGVCGPRHAMLCSGGVLDSLRLLRNRFLRTNWAFGPLAAVWWSPGDYRVDTGKLLFFRETSAALPCAPFLGVCTLSLPPCPDHKPRTSANCSKREEL